MELHQTKEPLHTKGNHQQNRKKLTEWEKIPSNTTLDKGLISKVYKEHIQLNTKEKKL